VQFASSQVTHLEQMNGVARYIIRGLRLQLQNGHALACTEKIECHKTSSKFSMLMGRY